jgi:hypothetical protein
MSRPIELSRDEAEYLVELIEADATPQFMLLAAQLRKQWGMATQERQKEYEATLDLARFGMVRNR